MRTVSVETGYSGMGHSKPEFRTLGDISCMLTIYKTECYLHENLWARVLRKHVCKHLGEINEDKWLDESRLQAVWSGTENGWCNPDPDHRTGIGKVVESSTTSTLPRTFRLMQVTGLWVSASQGETPLNMNIKLPIGGHCTCKWYKGRKQVTHPIKVVLWMLKWFENLGQDWH